MYDIYIYICIHIYIYIHILYVYIYAYIIYTYMLIYLPYFHIYTCNKRDLNGAGVFVAGSKMCCIFFVMDNFENQIITVIKKIRNANRRPDADHHKRICFKFNT